MNLYDCIFVFPPSGPISAITIEQYSYSLGSGYVIAHLQANGVAATQFYSEERLRADECAARIVSFSPQIVGFTVFNTNFIACILIAERIKALRPKTIIVFGGPTSSVFAEFIVQKHECVDICVRNEGEDVFLNLFENLSQRHFTMDYNALTTVKSITYRCDGKARNNPNANILLNMKGRYTCLDRYPSPYLAGIIPPAKAPFTGIITARGCNQNCTYCNCAVLSNRKFTMHSVERVVAEIDFISWHLGQGQVLPIYDDAFSILTERAKQICRTLIENKIRINLQGITRCDLVDEELLDLMKAAGFVSIGFSLESAVPRLLRLVGKVHPPEDVPSDGFEKEEHFIATFAKVASYAKRVGIRTVYSSIILGLPTETVEEATQTINMIEFDPRPRLLHP